MDEEIWKVIPDWPEYEVSDHGRVRRKMPGSGVRGVGYILKQNAQKSGHLNVSLSRNGHVKNLGVHRLVAGTFLTGSKHLDVCHTDGNPQNNHISNLRYDTRKGNAADAIRQGRTPKGEKNGQNKYTEETVRNLKEELKKGTSVRLCSELFNIPTKRIRAIKSGQSWGWLILKD